MHPLIRRLNSMVSTVLQRKLLNSFYRMIDIEEIDIQKDEKGRYPFLNKFQVVKVKFVGTGTVLDEPHFAIVWDAFPKNEHVVVLPMTSQLRSDKFDLGPIVGLEKPVNVVKANQPQSVSRKSISIWTKKIQDTNGEESTVPIILESHQQIQVTDLFRRSQLQEPTLYQVLETKIGPNLPVSFEEHMYTNIERPVNFIINGNFLHYWTYDKIGEVHSIEIANLKVGTYQSRKNLLAGIFSRNSRVRTETLKEHSAFVTVYRSKLEAATSKSTD